MGLDRLEILHQKLHTLIIFRGLLGDELLRMLLPLLSPAGKNLIERLDGYSDFVSRLFREGGSLAGCVWDRVSSDENFYIAGRARGEAMDPALERCLREELAILEELSRLTAREVKRALGCDGSLLEWKDAEIDFAAEYAGLLRGIATRGYGAFSRYSMFALDGGEIAPVRSPDPVRLSDLKGYERERKAAIDNALALLRGRPAANALLYGDAGTGKSSTVKAIVNEFAPRGLRLIEIRKNQLDRIPAVVERLAGNPLKFILFIDDLSFVQNSEEIGALKAVLEGTVSARAPGVVLYATSNRRHIVSERFSDRGDDEIHRNETIQEQVSLSQRFGLSVPFLKPDRARYLAIVRELALQYGVRDIEEIDLKAERYAIERGGRSPRVARQFVESLKSAEE